MSRDGAKPAGESSRLERILSEQMSEAGSRGGKRSLETATQKAPIGLPKKAVAAREAKC